MHVKEAVLRLHPCQQKNRVDAPWQVSRADAWGLGLLDEAHVIPEALDSRLRGNDIGGRRE